MTAILIPWFCSLSSNRGLQSSVMTVQEAVMEAQERRQPLMELVGPSAETEHGLAGQQVAKQEALGHQDLQHILDAVLPAAQPSQIQS